MEGPTAPLGKWVLQYGTHAGTLTTRDNADPTTHDSRELALQAFTAVKEYYESRGLHIWYAYIYDDQGRQTMLGGSSPIN